MKECKEEVQTGLYFCEHDLEPLVVPGLYFCEQEDAGAEIHFPSDSSDCSAQREGLYGRAAPRGPGRTAMSTCRDWMQLPVNSAILEKPEEECLTSSCKGWLSQPTSVEEALICDVARCSEKGVGISYLYADSECTPLFAM